METQNFSLEADILSHLDDVVFSAEFPSLEVRFVSPSIFSLTGYSPQDFLNNPKFWTNLVHSDDLAVIGTSLELLKKFGMYKLRYKILTKEGKTKFVQNRGRLIYDQNKNPIRLDGVITDISDLLSLSSNFKEESSEVQFLILENDMIFHGTQDAMFLVEVTNEGLFVIRRINKAYEKSTGVTQMEVQGKTPVDILGPELGNKVIQNYIRCVHEGKPIAYEESFAMPAGQKIWTTVLSPVFIDEKIRYIVGSGKDITELKLAEIALKESNERYNLIIESSIDGWWDWDIKKNTVIYSKRWWSEFGNNDEPTNIPISYWLSIIHPDEKDWVLEYLENALNSQKENFELTFQMKNKTGNYIHVLSKCFVQKDEEGNNIRMVGSNLDLTERIRYENTLKESKDLAEAANIAKGNFLANMSHEIRTPLNGIIGFSELLLRSHLDEEQTEFLNNIYISGKNLLLLVNQILDFSKIDSGKFELEILTVDLRDLLDSTIDLFSIAAKSKQIKLISNIDQRLPKFVSLDPLRLRQVLSNLLGNAIKFTDAGSVELRVQVLETKENIVKLNFQIMDSGIGIDHEAQKRLFKSFTQGDTSITRKYGGTGLGLAITAELLSKMKSKLNLKSELGQGSDFSFELNFPISSVGFQAAEIFEKKKPVVPDFTISESQKMGKILVVEDNELNSKLVAKMISKKYPNIHITIASDGFIAIQEFAKQKLNLIFMDIQMPNMDGYTATKEIRKLEKGNSKVPIIALTAGALYGMKETAVEAGMVDFLTKPVSSTDLYSMIEKWLT